MRSVENGMQAIAESTNWLPHLIWMDIRMPIINGYEAAKKIREVQTDIPPKIIATTVNPLKEENSIFLSLMTLQVNRLRKKPSFPKCLTI